LVVEVPVDGCAGHAEEVSDLPDGVVTGVVELLCEGDLLGVEPGPAAAPATASARGGESVAGVGEDQLALELGEDGEHPEHRATFGRRRIDALLGDVQTDAALA
jgi:hypothetical protein